MNGIPERLDSRPLYLKAEEIIRQMIENGTYDIDEQLPSEEKLAAALGISRPTVRMALARLESLGMLSRLQGGGTFVIRRKPYVLDLGLETIQSLHPRASTAAGLPSRLRGLEIRRVAAGKETAQGLGIEVGTAVAGVERVVLVGDEPAAYLSDYIPESVVGVMELQASFTDSVLDFFARRAPSELSYCRSEISIFRAAPPMTTLLEVADGEPLFQLDEIFYSANDAPVDWSRNYFVPKHFRFHVVRQVVP
jgi:GntR family transcriptional regulator